MEYSAQNASQNLPSKKESPSDGESQKSTDSLETCPSCGGTKWEPIPDSLAQYCKCGFVRVGSHGEYEKGASLQEWAEDQHKIRTIGYENWVKERKATQ
jgi:hypothetical protein